MALATSSSVTNATLYHDPVRAVLWPARAVGIFNFLVIMAFSVPRRVTILDRSHAM